MAPGYYAGYACRRAIDGVTEVLRPSVQPVQVRAAVVVPEDLVVGLARRSHAHRAHLAHPDAVTEAGAAEHERVSVAGHLEQRRLQAAEHPADPQITGDVDRLLVALDR